MILLRTRASIALNVATCLRAVGRFFQAVEVAKDVKNVYLMSASRNTMHDTPKMILTTTHTSMYFMN